jgi:phosphotransacetylase
MNYSKTDFKTPPVARSNGSGVQGAGIVLGAKVPIILTSRAGDAENRVVSCALALLYARTKPV